jgi:hypothetical protein
MTGTPLQEVFVFPRINRPTVQIIGRGQDTPKR